jgi:hypothetical protein
VDGKTTVELTPFAEKAQFEKGTLFFDADGLLVKQVVALKADPDNPQTAMMAGSDLETTFKYAKSGSGYVVETANQTTPMGDTSMNFSYFDVKDQPKLLKRMDMTNPMMQLTVEFHDYALDGKAIAGTEKGAAEKKEEKPAAPPAEKPAEPTAPKDGK